MFALSKGLSVVVIDDDDDDDGEVIGQVPTRNQSGLPPRYMASTLPRRSPYIDHSQVQWQHMLSSQRSHYHTSSRRHGNPDFWDTKWAFANRLRHAPASLSHQSPNVSHLEANSFMSTPNNPFEIIDNVDIDHTHTFDSKPLFRDTPDGRKASDSFIGRAIGNRERRKAPSSSSDSFGRLSTYDDDMVEIGSLEQEDDLDAQDYNAERSQNLHANSSSIPSLVRRNPTITSPLLSIPEYAHRDLSLRPNKTVELQDSDFLRITDITINPQTAEVRLRGHRLQRVKDLNGMLEKKLNEVVLFYEVDLDDPRDPDKQAVIEVPLSEVSRMRQARLTNQKFPEGRNVDPSHFASKDDAARNGGLTVRWKYTAIYTSALERNNNNIKERTLERIKSQDANPQFSILESFQKAEWRGETISGGSYRPTIEAEQEDWQKGLRADTPIRFTGNPAMESSYSPLHGSLIFLPVSVAKRKISSEHGVSPRKRQMNHYAGEETRRQTLKSRISINRSYQNKSRNVIDLCGEIDESVSAELSVPPAIDPFSSRLSSPPSSGEISSTVKSKPLDSNQRLPGQKYTYGDAFCGAGGTTRGAVMAGLRVKWGFDFFEHSCKTWRANFQSATLYQLEANAFVQAAQTAEARGFPDIMKVDILHLSPPCQFFSPAHTVDGVMDETNVASLFAVQSVIKVSKARVVTLEQTFGIAGPRFRFYFNAVIQMFTIHNFSVRWAVVPLAQWGLPQRRNRLIIIAACPGETLPRMPIPTHSKTPTGNQKPYLSVAAALASIPPSAPNHNPESLLFPPHRYMRPYDASQILPRAMTTHGGQNYHPSGKRGLTLREYAALQGFPAGHEFRGSHIKRQIGNAVPPSVAKVLFESIRRDLEKADGILDEPEVIE